MALTLKYEVVAAPDASPRRSALFLHGILGAGVNLRSLAKRFVAQRPEWQGVLVDLRAHGGSQGRDGVDSVEGAAADVVALAGALSAAPLKALIGHSFGGKVALKAAEQLPGVEHVALIDSAPGTRDDRRGSELTMSVLRLLEALGTGPWPSREAFVRELVNGGQERGVALWLAMNLAPAENGQFRLTLELPRIHALLESYFALDAWSVLERPSTTRFHLIIGERSLVYDQPERERAQALEASTAGRVTVDLLPAGHWVHVDDFEGLLRVLVRRLGETP